MVRQWTNEDIRSLGVKTDVETANSIFGIGRATGYDQIRRGTYPVPVLRIGRRVVVPVAGILAALGLEPAEPDSRQLTA